MTVANLQEIKNLGINLHPMKKIEIIVAGEHEKIVTKMMEEAAITDCKGSPCIRSLLLPCITPIFPTTL